MEKVAIYCRLSKEDVDRIKNGDDSESIQNQKALLIEYATKNNWNIYRIYCDEDYSGTDKNRPDWNKMIEDARERRFSIILCKTQSRFTREMEVVEKYIHTLFPKWHIRFVSLVDNGDTTMKGNKKSRQINGLINEWYVEDLSENVRAVYRQKMEVGEFLGAFAPYGYKKDEKNKYKLIIDEEAAAVVRSIFRWVLEGEGAFRICQRLTNSKIPTPTEHKQSMGLKMSRKNEKKRTLGLWSTTTINRILHNEIYIGNMVQHKEEKESYKSSKIIKVPKEEWIIIENTHEPIVEKEVFNKVQEILSTRKKLMIPSEKKELEKNVLTIMENSVHQSHIFAGKVRCMSCQSSMHKCSSRNKKGEVAFEYLRCSLAIRSKNRHCSPHRIRYDLLRNVVKDEIIKLMKDYLNESDVESILEEVSKRKKKVKCNYELDYNEVHQLSDGPYDMSFFSETKDIIGLEISLQQKMESREQLTSAITQLYIDKVEGLLSDEEFLAIKNEITTKRKVIIREIDVMKEQIKEYERKIINKYENKLSVLDLLDHENHKVLLNQKVEENQKITLDQKIEENHKLEIGESERKKEDNYREYPLEIQELTREIVWDFIDYIEVGELEENTIQISIHWNF